eukprot:SAG11_NODE_22201_length_410_cov_0.868167_1_plen_78_part_00
MLLAKLRPKLEPILKAKGLAWEDVLPALQLIDTLEEIKAAVSCYLIARSIFLDGIAAAATASLLLLKSGWTSDRCAG